ncbi:MAG TPA: D-2-hydroxyacid dehydrogenase [Pseudonocardiaceae bacterium]|nr:D-2-hydroxyacid dehydrogenase [Pseudonocardiaceae bacterium]
MADQRKPSLVVLTGDTVPPEKADMERIADVRYVHADGLATALPGADALFVWDFRSTAVAPAWPSEGGPRWVHIASAGVDRLLFPGLADTTVTNSRGVFEEPIADYVLMLVLCFAKGLHTTLRHQAEHRWRHRTTEQVAGRRVLVVGTGPIGRAIGRRLRSLGLHVTGAGRVPGTADLDLGRIVGPDGLRPALADADYVVLAAPLTDATRHMINADTLAAMRPTARLINVARGELVVQTDLVAALSADRIAGAALDVFTDEPLPASSPLWDMPNVIVSPHMSGDLTSWEDDLARLFLDNLRRFAAGRPLRNVVDKSLGYVPSSESTQSATSRGAS